MCKIKDLQVLSILLLWRGIAGDVSVTHTPAVAAHSACHPSYFKCDNNLCIKESLRCDHIDHCGDNSDERNCDVKSAPTSCHEDEYLCQRPPMCISIEDLCSDFNQCNDYDAISSLCPFECQPHKWKCQNVSQCIEKKHICDGSKDCMDGSDEMRCDDEKYKCEEETDSFLCDDQSHCIFAVDVCDGHEMCEDGSDEKNDCHKLCEAKKCGTNQFCLPAGRGVKCVCKDGYEFDKDYNCIERNYCKASDIDRPCSQTCIEGRFGRGPQCHCITGYNLNKDGTSCSASGSEAIMYVATASEIHRWTIKTQNYSTLIDGLKGVKGLAVDMGERRIFWSEIGGGDSNPEVLAMDIDGGEKTKTVVASFVLQKPEGLAYDFITKNLYIVDSGIPAILVCELNQLNCVTIFNSTVFDSPKDIVLNPAEGLLYYTETGSKPAIMRGSMDGSSSSPLVSINIHRPTSLHIDFTTNRLYWIDSLYFSGTVFKVDLDGTNKKIVMSHKITSPQTLSIFEDNIYWVTDKTKAVMTANKFTASDAKIIFQNTHQPTALVIDHESLQNDHVINRCHSNRCHLCLLSDKRSGSCFCTQGYQAAFTQQYCEKIEAPSFLLASDKTRILRLPLNITGRPTISYLKTSHMSDVNSLAYLPKVHSVVYSTLNSDKYGDASIRLIRGMDDGIPQSAEVVSGVPSIMNIAVDETSSLVFWTDYKKRSIRVASLYDEFQASLPINTTLPNALCVDGPRGILYFSEASTSDTGAFIKQCRLDGQSCSRLVSNRIQSPNHLLAQGQQLYWSDYSLAEISMIDRWGNDRTTIVVTDGNPLSFAMDGGILYWIEDGKNSIFYKHIYKIGGYEGSIETEANSLKYLIAVVPHTFQQSACTNSNGGCEQICISINRGVEVSCMCSEGFRLHADKKQCVQNKPGCNGPLCGTDGQCLHESQVCDGVFDCQDQSDESGCPNKMACSADDFQCTNGQCISEDFKCDDWDDCKDGSDEAPELCPVECDSGDHVCGDGKCIDKGFVCDQHPDCEDESDESMCPEVKKCDKYSCGEDQCIPEEWVCDGDKDCDDEKDEIGCGDICREDEFTCDDGDCIDKQEVCDHFDNCWGGEDEQDCSPMETCSENEYRCFNGECIHKTAKCDGNYDCPDHEDEDKCHDFCRVTEFQCGNDECISYDLLCDFKMDCADGSDEVDCEVSCKNFRKCGQICVDSPFGPTCDCEPGYRLKTDGIACEDIDECKIMNGGCSQRCVNVKGRSTLGGFGFICQCFDGFERGHDHYSCKAQGKRPELYVGHSFGVDKIVEGQHRHQIIVIPSDHRISDLELDIKRKSILWTGITPQKNHMTLFQMMDGQAQPQVILEMFLIDFHLDWITGNLYVEHISDRGDLAISVVKILSNSKISLIHQFTALSYTRHSLVLHPPKGIMFYEATVSQQMIVRASMDGTGQKEMPLATSHARGDISHFTIDTTTDRLYWLDRVFGRIKSVTIEDKDPLTYDLHINARSLRSMEIFDGLAYMAMNNSILSYPLHKGGKQGLTTVGRVMRPLKIKISHPLIQPMVPNPCQQKECMYMCLLSENGGASCVCPDFYQNTNYHSCEGKRVPLDEIKSQLGIKTSTIPPATTQMNRERQTNRVPTHKKSTPPNKFTIKKPPTPKAPTTPKEQPAPKEWPTQRPTPKEHPTHHNKWPTHKEPTKSRKPTKAQGHGSSTPHTTLVFIPHCTLSCLNGGSCVADGGAQSCRCLDEFEGPLCGKEIEQKKKIEEEEESFGWVAGLVVGLVLLIFLIVFAVWYYKYRRHSQNLSSIRFQKQNKFVICNQEDKEGLVPEISFGNPGFQEEIDEEAHMHEDQDWWKKLLSRSKRTVGSDFHGKNHSTDDLIDGCMRGDPQDSVTSDKARLLK